MKTIKILLLLVLSVIWQDNEIYCQSYSLFDNKDFFMPVSNGQMDKVNSRTTVFDYHLQNDIVILMFVADWHVANKRSRYVCRQLYPELINDPISYIFIDIDSFPEVADFYGITKLPNSLFYKKGELKYNEKTMPSVENFQIIISELLGRPIVIPPPPPPVIVVPPPIIISKPPVFLDNHVLTRIYQYTGTDLYTETVQYLDGLGREILTVNKGITPNRQDLAMLTEFDYLGRTYKKWLPGITLKGKKLDVGILKDSIKASMLYGRDEYPYSEIRYELSSLERVSKNHNPGSAWRKSDRAVTTEYLLNSVECSCSRFNLTLSGKDYLVNKVGDYPVNKLLVTKVIDEDGNISFVYSDQEGQKILMRQMLGTTAYDTYYIYDQYGNLCVILPPKAVKSLQGNGPWSETAVGIKDLSYRYKYDSRKRCIAKKLPGVEWVYNVYDNMDRLVMSQDGNLRKNRRWNYSVYDELDRLILNNIVVDNNNLSRDSIQAMYNTWFDANYPLLVKIQDVGKPFAGTGFKVDAKLQEVKYGNYDYPVSFAGSFSKNLSFQPVSLIVNSADSRITGLKVHEKLYLLDNVLYTDHPNSIERAYYYDDKGRVTQIVTKNQFGRISRESFKYDFVGNILVQHEQHEISLGKIDSLKKTFVYDHASRLLSSTVRLNNGSPVSINYSYDELGRILCKSYGSGQRILTDSLSYNLRGWLEKQNNEVFEAHLRYDKPKYTGSVASYSGNITEWEWRQKNRGNSVSTQNAYVFSYDV